ncbi:MAG: hypothetical protein JO257_09795 [Deltaproteobacteria bacterium]|nr:hypothetical protein [Deltaproteobacteria bacterium]
MTSSTSSISKSSFWLVVAALLVWSSIAVAGRKRLVVLEFEGPKAEKFHDDVVKLLKKSHTVISTEKWNGAAEELDAAKVTEKNVKKVAKKLKVDGVISGKIEKRRDEYIIRLKLRAGTSGELVGNSIDTKAEGPRLDGKAQSDLKDELVGQIDELDSNKGGGGDDDDEADSKASKKKKHADDDEADADTKPVKKKKGADKSDDEDSSDDSSSKHSAFSKQHDMKGSDKVDDEDKPKKADKKAKKDDDEDADAKPKKADKKKKSDDDDADTKAALSTKHDEDDTPLPKADKKKKDKSDDEDSSDDKPKKKVAKKDDDEDSSSVSSDSDEGDVDMSDALTPARRAIDVAAGLSFTGRNLGFTYKSTLSTPPPGYKQAIPVAGGMFDATFYPLAFNKKNREITSGIGLEVLYDKALKINSQKRYLDTNGAGQVANLTTSESRLKIAAVFRYPLGKGEKATVVGGKLGYQAKTFSILQTLPNGDPTDVPNVAYKMIEPEAFLIYPASPKMNINVSAGFLAVTNTGDMQKPTEYGAASVTGFEFAGGIDYNVTKNIFLRGEAMLQTIGMTFKGDPMSLANTRDNDPATQEVLGARDTYFGGAVTLGYAY